MERSRNWPTGRGNIPFSVFDIGVAYKEDVDEVMRVMEEVGADLQKDETIGPMILEPIQIVGVDQFAESAVVIKARIKTTPIQQWAVGRAYNRLLKIRFDAEGIEFPFPHRTVLMHNEDQGDELRKIVREELGKILPSSQKDN